jgi:hypothetical protein
MPDQVSKSGNWKIYGSDNPEILVAGHSHTFSLLWALNKSEKFNQYFGIVTRTNLSEHINNDDEYWDFVSQSAKNRKLAISWNGNQHNIHFLVDSKLEFNSMGFQTKRDAPFVTRSRIDDLFRPTFYELELVLSRFTNTSNICLLGTPPPKSKSYLDQRLKNDPFFLEVGKNLGIKVRDIKASSDDLRVFMWKQTQILTKQVADKFQCDFLPSPGETHDSNYILEERFSADDLTHTNPDYGNIVLEDICRHFGVKVEN